METLYPSSFLMSNSGWLSSSTSEWTKEENKRFESALAMISEKDPLRWIKVAALIPTKSVEDVIKQYRELLEDVSNIEAGKVPIPGYLSSSFTFEFADERDFDGYRKRPLTSKASDQERKKGVPWTEDEHRRFLMGLMKQGKGDWRNISRNFVVTKTPTQVASHAQKYFIRQQLSGVKDKRRPSIHDITTSNLSAAPPDPSSLLNQPIHRPSALAAGSQKVLIDWNRAGRDASNSAVMVFGSGNGNLFMSGQNPNMGSYYHLNQVR